MKFKDLNRWISKLIFGSILLISACDSGDGDIDPGTVQSRLSTSLLIQVRTATDMQGVLSIANLDIPLEKIIYDVEIWKVNYTSTYGEQEVTASGLVFLPKTEETLPFLSYQHGTVADNVSVPSQAQLGDGQNLLLSALAGAGFITVASDYIGFGSSIDIVHPYYVEQPTRDAIFDNLRAAVELAEENERIFSNRLYLIGYSQGGYATMAAHKGFEEGLLEYFDLQASFPSSGGYDIMGMRDYFVSLETYDQPFYMAFVSEAYKNYYGWDESMTSLFFEEPYASIIPDLFDGSLSGSQINDMLTDNISDLLTSEFIENPDDEAFQFVNEKFVENSLIEWTPTIPMYMYHGDADSTVIYQNSIDSHAQLIANGADPNIVTFTSLPGATHGSGFIPYLIDFLDRLVEAEGL